MLSKVYKNSIYNIKDRLFYSSDLKENIHLADNVFSPIFILDALVKVKEIEIKEDEINLLELKIKDERFAEQDSKHISIERKIKDMYNEVYKFFQKNKNIEESIEKEFYKFIHNNSLYNIKKDEMISEEEFIKLFRKMYKLLLNINYSVSIDKKNEIALFSIFKTGLIRLGEEEIILSEYNLGIDFLRKEIHKRFLFNKINLNFYNMLIDFQILSIEELNFSGLEFKKMNVDLESVTSKIFYDSILVISANKIFLREENKLETEIFRSFTIDNLEKIKELDFINVEFSFNEKVREQLHDKINLEKIEEIKFFVLCFLIENGYINNSKGNILKNVKIVSVNEENSNRVNIANNILFIKLSKDELKLELELELIIKIFTKSEKAIFEKKLVSKKKSELSYLESFNKKNNVLFKALKSTQQNIYFVALGEYFMEKIKKEVFEKADFLKIKFPEIMSSELSKKIIVNPVNFELKPNKNSLFPMEMVILKIYLYIYLECLYLMCKDKYKNEDIGSFIDFTNRLKNYNLDNLRLRILKYINYYYYNKYELSEKVNPNVKVSDKSKKTLKMVESIINDNKEYVFLSKLAEFVYHQILNKLYLINVSDIELLKEDELRKHLEINNIDEKEFVKRIVDFFGKYKKEFEDELSFKVNEVEYFSDENNKNKK